MSSEQKQIRIGQFVDTLADPIVAFGDDGMLHAANRAAESLVGLHEALSFDDFAAALARTSRTPEATLEALRAAYGASGGTPQRIAVAGGSYEVRGQRARNGRALFFRHVGRADDAPTEADEILFQQGRANFLTLMGHNLRTPLNSILGFAEIIALQAFGAEARERYREYANDIVAEATRLHESLDALITLASIETEDVAIRMEVVDVGVALERAIEAITVKETRGAIVLEVPVARLQCRADPDLLHQALVSILAHACRQSPGAECVASVRRRDDAIVFSLRVREGITKTPDERQPDSDCKTALWIAHTIASAHGGGLRFVHAGDNSSEIRLVIPVG